jgi:hypothetical protein
MRQLKFVATAVTAVFSLAAVTAAMASAAATLPNVLPEATALEPITSTGSSGKSAFGDGLEQVTSEKSKAKELQVLLKLGTFDLLLEGTKDELGTACTGLEDTETGSILVLGTFHYFDFNRGGQLLVAVGLLLLPVHFSCGSAILVIEHGCLAGAINTPLNTTSSSLTIGLTQKSGNNEIITVLNAENTAAFNCEFLASQNEAEFKLSSQERLLTLLGFKLGTKAISVLVMPL